MTKLYTMPLLNTLKLSGCTKVQTDDVKRYYND
jgi:hypothetical protein